MILYRVVNTNGHSFSKYSLVKRNKSWGGNLGAYLSPLNDKVEQILTKDQYIHSNLNYLIL